MKIEVDFDDRKINLIPNGNPEIPVAKLYAIMKTSAGEPGFGYDWKLEILDIIGKEKQEQHVNEDQQPDEWYAILPNYDVGITNYSLVRNDGIIIDKDIFNNHLDAVREWQTEYLLEDLTNEQADKLQQKVNETTQSKI